MESLGLSPSFWRGRRVLLTGHTGFKGTWLALWLEMLGAEVAAFALAPETEALWTRLTPAPVRHSTMVDLRDAQAVARAAEEAAPQLVLHLAAQAIVRRGYDNPVATFASNVQGTVNLMEAIRGGPRPAVLLVITSDKVYSGDPGEGGFEETHPLGGEDPYSASKAACEIAVAGYAEALLRPAGVAVATARAGNIVGGGDMGQDRLVPDLVRALRAGGALRLRAPQALRPWLHILDALHGYLLFAQRLTTDFDALPCALNFGPNADSRRSVRELIETACAAWGTTPLIEIDRSLPVEPKPLWLNSTRARQALGWAPRLDFSDTIGWTMDWWHRLARGETARAICERQIAAYSERCR